jgi:hypothetical protein
MEGHRWDLVGLIADPEVFTPEERAMFMWLRHAIVTEKFDRALPGSWQGPPGDRWWQPRSDMLGQCREYARISFNLTRDALLVTGVTQEVIAETKKRVERMPFELQVVELEAMKVDQAARRTVATLGRMRNAL